EPLPQPGCDLQTPRESVDTWRASAPARDFVASIVQAVEMLSWEGYPDIHLTAEFLGMNVRTLQRYLAAAGSPTSCWSVGHGSRPRPACWRRPTPRSSTLHSTSATRITHTSRVPSGDGQAARPGNIAADGGRSRRLQASRCLVRRSNLRGMGRPVSHPRGCKEARHGGSG